MNTSSRGRLGLILLTVCVLAGCDREPAVSKTSQPKETTPAAPAPAPGGNAQMPPNHPPIPPGAQMPGMEQAQEERNLAWTVPAGWNEEKTPRPMREATFTVGEGDRAAEVAVTRLGQFGEFAANINRWRGQVGLEPAGDAATTPARTLKSQAGEVKVYQFDGPENTLLVGMLKQGDVNWFFKLIGPKAVVAQNAASFDQFLQSLRTKD